MLHRFAALALVTVLAVSLPLHAQERGAAGDALPPGPGRDVVAVACAQCHGLGVITQLREGEQAWRFQVYDMVTRGAQVGPGEIDAVAKYLATSFGPGVPLPGPAPAAVSLPAGAGKELVEGACGLCHGLDRAVAARRDATEWKAIVHRMTFFGAPLDAAQGKAVTEYLAANFGAK